MNCSHQDGEAAADLPGCVGPLPPPLCPPIRPSSIHEVRSMQYLKRCSYGLLLLLLLFLLLLLLLLCFSFFNSMYGLCSVSVLWTCCSPAALTGQWSCLGASFRLAQEGLNRHARFHQARWTRKRGASPCFLVPTRAGGGCCLVELHLHLDLGVPRWVWSTLCSLAMRLQAGHDLTGWESKWATSSEHHQHHSHFSSVCVGHSLHLVHVASWQFLEWTDLLWRAQVQPSRGGTHALCTAPLAQVTSAGTKGPVRGVVPCLCVGCLSLFLDLSQANSWIDGAMVSLPLL